MAGYRKSRGNGNVFYLKDRFGDLKKSLKEGLMSLCLRCGTEAFSQMLADEAEAKAGPKGKHNPARAAHHWGTTSSDVVLGGGKVSVQRPRVRSMGGAELSLPSLVAASREDLLQATMMEAIICGVSTRGYGRVIEATTERRGRSTSRSSVSRRIVEGTRRRMADILGRSLADFDLLVLMMDGVHVGEHVILVTLGINRGGEKRILGIREGSTENAAVATALLNDLRERGLVLDRCLTVIDGGKGLRKAITDVMGKDVAIQRCRLHKERNVLDHLPRERRSWIKRLIRKAWDQETEEGAKAAMLALARLLENDFPGAAASVREGLDDLFTIKRLGLKGRLAAALSSTNMIESLIGRGRAVTGKVKRWRSGGMVMRWMGTALSEAENGFRKVHGYRELPPLEGKLGRAESLLSTEKTA
jgi:transposase-like protein